MSDITELATIRNKPVINAGTHKSRNAGDVVVTEEELDDIIEGSNALKELIKESMSTGVYRGNDIKAGFVPGALNLHHNDFLDETMKERTKDIDWEWSKVFQDGKPWAAVTYKNVPQDVAKALKAQFPIVSAELLPLTDPDTGKHYPKVIRSTAFLDRFTPPAVKGQSDDVHVEFSEGETPVTVLYSAITEQSTQEEGHMADKKTDAMPETGNEEEVSELTGKLSESVKIIAELQAEKAAETTRIAELEAARETDRAALAELQAGRDAAEVRELMAAFSGQVLTGQGTKWALSKAFTSVVNPLLTGIKRSDVMELSGESKPARDAMKDAFQSIAEMAAKGSILVPISELGAVPEQDEDTPAVSMETRMKEIAGENPSMSATEVWAKAADETGLFKGGN